MATRSSRQPGFDEKNYRSSRFGTKRFRIVPWQNPNPPPFPPPTFPSPNPPPVTWSWLNDIASAIIVDDMLVLSGPANGSMMTDNRNGAWALGIRRDGTRHWVNQWPRNNALEHGWMYDGFYSTELGAITSLALQYSGFDTPISAVSAIGFAIDNGRLGPRSSVALQPPVARPPSPISGRERFHSDTGRMGTFLVVHPDSLHVKLYHRDNGAYTEIWSGASLTAVSGLPGNLQCISTVGIDIRCSDSGAVFVLINCQFRDSINGDLTTVAVVMGFDSAGAVVCPATALGGNHTDTRAKRIAIWHDAVYIACSVAANEVLLYKMNLRGVLSGGLWPRRFQAPETNCISADSNFVYVAGVRGDSPFLRSFSTSGLESTIYTVDYGEAGEKWNKVHVVANHDSFFIAGSVVSGDPEPSKQRHHVVIKKYDTYGIQI